MIRNGDGRGEAGRVLVNIKRTVEVGDIGPFRVDIRVDADAVVIGRFQLVIDLVERRCGQRLTGGVQLVRFALKFGKQRLAVERRAEAFEEMVEDIGSAAGIGLGLQQILGQQDFVDR